MTMPRISPIAQPVRQCTVALKAIRFRDWVCRAAYPQGYQRSVTSPTSPSSFQSRSSTFAGIRVRWG